MLDASQVIQCVCSAHNLVEIVGLLQTNHLSNFGKKNLTTFVANQMEKHWQVKVRISMTNQ
jgi:precorrin-6x reductase